jgi:hypothetical protein
MKQKSLERKKERKKDRQTGIKKKGLKILIHETA